MELAGDRVFNGLSLGFVGVDAVSTARGERKGSVPQGVTTRLQGTLDQG
jgi:hypothetical protein